MPRSKVPPLTKTGRNVTTFRPVSASPMQPPACVQPAPPRSPTSACSAATILPSTFTRKSGSANSLQARTTPRASSSSVKQTLLLLRVLSAPSDHLHLADSAPATDRNPPPHPAKRLHRHEDVTALIARDRLATVFDSERNFLHYSFPPCPIAHRLANALRRLLTTHRQSPVAIPFSRYFPYYPIIKSAQAVATQPG